MRSISQIISSQWILLAGSLVFFCCISAFAYTSEFLWLIPPFALAFAAWPVLNWKSFFLFMIFAIPLSAEVTFLNGRLATTVPDEQMMWLLVPIIILVILYRPRTLPSWFLRHPLTLILFLQFVWLIVAVLFSENLLPSLKFLAAKSWFLLSYLILPVLVFRSKKDLKKAFLLFVIPVTLHAIFAFCWHYKSNFGFFESNRVVKPFYQNHVDYSTILSMVFPLLLIAYQMVKGKKWLRILLLVTIIFYLPAIYFASARAAMLAVVFALAINWFVRKKIVMSMMTAGFLLLFTLIGFLAHNNKYFNLRPDFHTTATQESFIETVTASFAGKDMSSMERFYRWIASVRMSADRPLTGVGPNNFYDHYKGYAITMFKTWVSRNEEKSTTHNYFLFMLVEQGWPAMILYGVLVFGVLYHGQRMYHEARDPFYKKAIMGLIMVFAAGFVNNFFSELIETHKVGALFYISIASLIVIDHLSRQRNKQLSEASTDTGISPFIQDK